MSARLGSTRVVVGLVLTLSLALTSCGGGGSSGSDDAAPGTTPTTDESDTDIGSLPEFEVEPREFEELDGSKARFINLFANEGEGVEMDVYWGMDAESGKKATTVGYGEVSDWMPIEIETNPLMEGTDGGTDVDVAFYVAGETDLENRIQQKSESVDGDVLYTFTMGTTVPFDSSVGFPSSLSLGYDHRTGDPGPPAGQAWIGLNTIGVGGIEGGDFMVPNSADGCNDLTNGDVGDTANSGQAWVVDAGTTEFTASDANSDCPFKTPPVSVDLEEGEGYILFAYGTTLEDRQLLAVKVGE